MGKRILRKLQRQAARRTAQRRNLLHIKGGKDRDRRLAAALQQGASSLVTRLSASSAGGDRLASTEASGANARSKLTSQTDHSVGAGHCAAQTHPTSFLIFCELLAIYIANDDQQAIEMAAAY